MAFLNRNFRVISETCGVVGMKSREMVNRKQSSLVAVGFDP